MPILLDFLALSKATQFQLIWDLNNCIYPFVLKMVPIEIVKCFHDFHFNWKFKHANVNQELFATSTYQWKWNFNNCKVDCVMSLIALPLQKSEPCKGLWTAIWFSAAVQL